MRRMSNSDKFAKIVESMVANYWNNRYAHYRDDIRELINTLCDVYKLPRIKVIVRDHNPEVGGTYVRQVSKCKITGKANVKNPRINIWMNWKFRQKSSINFMKLLTTMIHEWCHYHDELTLGDTDHSERFYDKIEEYLGKVLENYKVEDGVLQVC